MKIKKLISIYKKLLPVYQECIDTKIIPRSLNYGLCSACWVVTDCWDISKKKSRKDYTEFTHVHSLHGYYRNYYKDNVYLFPKSTWLYMVTVTPETIQKAIKKCIIPRRDFLVTEIEDLKRLLKEGYTDV